MVMAKLHLICGNCGSSDQWEWEYHEEVDDSTVWKDVRIVCNNCATVHSLSDNAPVRSNAHDFGVTCHLSGEDVRHPLLGIQGSFGSVGYALDKDTGSLHRVCICAAREDGECACGAWSETPLN